MKIRALAPFRVDHVDLHRFGGEARAVVLARRPLTVAALGVCPTEDRI